MVGRGALLDIARFRGVEWMQDGDSISNDELDKCVKGQNVSIGRGDFVIVRTGGAPPEGRRMGLCRRR